MSPEGVAGAEKREDVPEGLGCWEGVLKEEFDFRRKGENVLDTGNNSQWARPEA